MSTKDIGKGWGNLSRSLTVWNCPGCGNQGPVGDWAIVTQDFNGFVMEGRKCPACDFKAFQHGETMRMIPESHLPKRDVSSELKIPPKRARKK